MSIENNSNYARLLSENDVHIYINLILERWNHKVVTNFKAG